MAHKAPKECAKDFWKFASQVLDENKAHCVDPDFPADTAESFFTSVYSSTTPETGARRGTNLQRRTPISHCQVMLTVLP